MLAERDDALHRLGFAVARAERLATVASFAALAADAPGVCKARDEIALGLVRDQIVDGVQRPRLLVEDVEAAINIDDLQAFDLAERQTNGGRDFAVASDAVCVLDEDDANAVEEQATDQRLQARSVLRLAASADALVAELVHDVDAVRLRVGRELRALARDAVTISGGLRLTRDADVGDGLHARRMPQTPRLVKNPTGFLTRFPLLL